MDEKSKELHETPRGDLPLEAGQPRRVDCEYVRGGVANLFLWVEPLTGRRGVQVTERRTAFDFAEQLRCLVEDYYPDAEKVVLVTDNLNTHNPACLYERFAPEQARAIAGRIEWHYTPEHGSWLNMAEIELSVLSRQCLSRRIAGADMLKSEVEAWQTRRNGQQSKIVWQFRTQDARVKLRRLYPTTKSNESS